MRRLWSGEAPFADADPVGPPPVQPGGPPIFTSARGPKAVARAVRWARGFTGASLRGLPSDMADATGRPDRFLALHFANLIWIHNVAEIMGHADTDAAVFDIVVDFARRIGMVPIELRKEQAGYVVNSLQVPFLQAAQALVVNGVADPATVDRAWRIAMGAPFGPFHALDVIGLRTAYNIDAAGDEQARANARYLKEHYIDQGKLGRATGEGFYKYDAAA